MKNFCTWIATLACMMLTACASNTPVVDTNDAGRPLMAPTAVASNSTPKTLVPKMSVPKITSSRDERDAVLALLLGESAAIIPDGDGITPQPNPKELKCMVQAMYFEARGEGNRGMLAVGHVVQNRTADERFPSTVCGVVKQGKYVNGKPVLNRCQFSWYCDGLSDEIKDKEAYAQIEVLARQVLMGTSLNPIGKSLFYHNTDVSPKWSRTFAKVKRIGNHIFYA